VRLRVSFVDPLWFQYKKYSIKKAFQQVYFIKILNTYKYIKINQNNYFLT
jgi:hypothetical protein